MNLWSKRFVASSGPALQGTAPSRSAFVPRAAQQAVGAEGKGASVIWSSRCPSPRTGRRGGETCRGTRGWWRGLRLLLSKSAPIRSSVARFVRFGRARPRSRGATQATRRSVRRAVERRPAGSWADVCWTEARFFPRRFRGAGRSSRASSPSDDDVAGWPAAVPPEWMQGSVFRRGRVREPVVIPASSARRLPPSAE